MITVAGVLIICLLLGQTLGFHAELPRRSQRGLDFSSRIHGSSTEMGGKVKAHPRNYHGRNKFVSLDSQDYNTTESLNEALEILCSRKLVRHKALPLLTSAETRAQAGDRLAPDAHSYVIVMKSLSWDKKTKPKELESMLSRMERFTTPTAVAYNVVISSWSRMKSPANADRLLKQLWSSYNLTRDNAVMPDHGTYMAVMMAYSRHGKREDDAVRTEQLLEEMEAVGVEIPALRPRTPFVNVVLSAWGKRGTTRAMERCKIILQRMENLALNGRHELAPSTVSYNTVIDALARCHDAMGGEELLMRMETLSQEHPEWQCAPDSISFNTVLKGWASNRKSGSAKRAEDILNHMQQRYKNNQTNLTPDESSFANVIHAYSRSRLPDAFTRANGVLHQMDAAYEAGDIAEKPTTMIFNSLINVLAKSGLSDAPEKALGLFERMETDGIARDVFTYTSLIDVFAKNGTSTWSQRAEKLLDEMIAEYQETRKADIKPNVRTFTSVINAIGRSNENPERALRLLRGMQEVGVKPDVVCYNAVINAYGWSNVKGKEAHAFALLQEMLQPESPVKPDIISGNSVLNCCSYATTETEAERAKVMEIAIQTLEIFEDRADHATYAHMLLAIAKLMPESESRESLAEATFWRCCKAGHLSKWVIQRLRSVLSKERLHALLGSAIIKNSGATFIFSVEDLPEEWQRHVTNKRKSKTFSRPSRKRDEPAFTKRNMKSTG